MAITKNICWKIEFAIGWLILGSLDNYTIPISKKVSNKSVCTNS